MPIYAYKCESCGHEQDVLQKLSEPLLTDCPACGASTYRKQVTAAGFQLKGSGWYVTDFRDNGKPGKSKGADAPAAGATGDGGTSKTGETPAVPAQASSKAADAPAAASPASSGGSSTAS